jgi:polyisoprenyl-teichoic acid--peptidoglycan teichoic acid transferase
MARRLSVIVIALALVAAACSGETATETTVATTTTSTTVPPTTTTTTQPGTTTTFTIPYSALDVAIDGEPGVTQAVQALYNWFGDRTSPNPEVPEGLLDHLAEAYPTGSASFSGDFVSEEIGEMGSVGVATINGQDIMLLVDEAEAEGETDTGWRLVGAWFAQYDVDPWFGNPLRYVFVIGTDARPGEFQQHLRADSLHILSSNIAEGSGGVLGIPRDTRVQASYGVDKYTNVNAIVFSENCGRVSGSGADDCEGRDAGQDEMVSIAAEFSGLPLEGWIVTGFLGFTRLVDAFGGVEVDVPVSMAEPNAEAYFSAGIQDLFGADALAFSRNRKQFGEIGDFVRSLHQGMLMLAAFDKVLEQDVTAVPSLLATLMEFTWTGLSLEDLFTLAAGTFLLDPGSVGNEVTPSTGGLQGGAYYANFTDDAEPLFRDMDDGSLTPTESWLSALYGN